MQKIVRELHVSRNTIRKILRYDEPDFSSYLSGNLFAVADAYSRVPGWMKGFGVDLGRWPKVAAYMRRIEVRPSEAAVAFVA